MGSYQTPYPPCQARGAPAKARYAHGLECDFLCSAWRHRVVSAAAGISQPQERLSLFTPLAPRGHLAADPRPPAWGLSRSGGAPPPTVGGHPRLAECQDDGG